MKRITLGLAMIAAASLGTRVAQADFVAYNDLSGDDSPGNVTNFTLGESGELIDFGTGAGIGVNVAVTTSTGARSDVTNTGASGNEFNTGTPGHQEFMNRVDFTGVIFYGSDSGSDDSYTITLSNLDPTQPYEFVLGVNRANPDYAGRVTQFTLAGADAFVNTSVVSNDESGESVGLDSATYSTGANAEGDIARFTSILAGTDGIISITATDVPDSGKGLYGNAFKLSTVPEPASLALLGIGAGLMMIRRKR